MKTNTISELNRSAPSSPGAKVAVVYHSATGTTQALAHAIIEGINTDTSVEVNELRIVGSDIREGRFVNDAFMQTLCEVDAVVFGTPTYMGSVSAQFKSFADASGELWSTRSWAGKVAAGFTIGSNYSGDQLSAIQYLNVFASQHGMLWTSLDIPGGYDEDGLNRLGAQSGLIAQSADGRVDPIDLGTARHLGMRVARFAKLVNAAPVKI